MIRPRANYVLAALLIVIVGCSASEDGYTGPRGTVTGKVTLDGKPVPAGCKVVFISLKEKQTYMASGITGVDGTFSLFYKVKAGLPAVQYQVEVSQPIDTKAAAATTKETLPTDPKILVGRVETPKSAPKTPEQPADDGAIPRRYNTIAISGLQITVQPGKNSPEIELENKVRKKK